MMETKMKTLEKEILIKITVILQTKYIIKKILKNVKIQIN